MSMEVYQWLRLPWEPGETVLAEVIVFAVVMSVFEFALLTIISPKPRLRLLGNETGKMCLHVSFLTCNLIVHWGTVVGTMSSTLSFITSLATVWVAVKLFGSIKDGRFYTVGFLKYSIDELR